jgi:hypothetical protein
MVRSLPGLKPEIIHAGAGPVGPLYHSDTRAHGDTRVHSGPRVHGDT